MAEITVVVGGVLGTRPSDPPPAPRAFPSTAGVHLLAGMPVAQSAAAPLTSVFADTRSLSSAAVTGLVQAEVAQGGQAHVQPADLLTLTVAQWAAVGVGAQGLVPSTVYYVSEEKPGLLAPARPRRPGSFATKVGVALSPVTMLVQVDGPTQVLPGS
jgi:hypothetical protein